MRYAYENEDGSVGVIYLVNASDATVFLPEGATMIGVVEELPHKAFRGCWKNDGADGVHVTLEDAKIDKMAQIRTERNGCFSKFDEVYNGKLAIHKDFNHVDVLAADAPRQQLRDIPQSVSGVVDSASTLDELIAIDGLQSVSGIL